MMQKAIYILIFSFFIAVTADAQNIEETYRFANRQFSEGNFEKAVTEYQRVAFFDSENRYNDVYQKTGDAFFALNDFNRAFKNYDMAVRFSNNDSLKTELIFKKVNCLFQQQNFIFALNELFAIASPNSNYLQNKYNLYMGISYFGIEQYDNALNYFSKLTSAESNEQLNEIFAGFKHFRKRFNPEKIQTMSMFLPGLGQFYMGKIGSGLNSLVLIGGIATATVYIWQVYGALDAFLSMSSWYYRYYSGGYKNAKMLAIEKNEHKKEQVYQSVLYLMQNNLEPNQ